MEDCTHTQIFLLCYVASATSAISSYAYSTLYSETAIFSYKKAAVYSFYFGAAGLITCMLGFDWFGGKKAWYKVLGVAGGVGIGAIRADYFIARLGGILPVENSNKENKK